MAYNPTEYVNDNPPAIDADNLNHMEQGIAEADANAISALNKVEDANEEIDILNNYVFGGYEGISFSQTGTGSISSSAIDYNAGATGNNQMMVINNLASVGLTIGDVLKLKLGWSTGFVGAIAFAKTAITGTVTVGENRVVSFPNTDSVQELIVTIPSETVAIAIFNRKPSLDNPEIGKAVIGLDDKVEQLESEIITIDDNLQEINSDVSGLEANVANSDETIYLNNLEFASKGYVAGNGDFVATTSTSHKIMSMDASYLKYLSFKTNTARASTVGFGVIKDANNVIKRTFPFDNTTNWQTFELSPESGDVLYVSWFNFATTPNPYYDSFKAKAYKSIVDAYYNEIKAIVGDAGDIRYNSLVKKPFDFSGKKLKFFGDSITYGYIAASGGTPAHQAENQYPKLFSQSVGALSFENNGRTGHTFAITEYGSIQTDLSTYGVTGCDYIFVAGGVNDWQTGVTEEDLDTAVRNVCNYINTNNPDAEVIFITPINESGRVPITTPEQTLQNVRNVITRIALEHGYSVVQGWEFPFPVKNDVSSYKTLMFQDNLHPTELGYSMYANALRNALC